MGPLTFDIPDEDEPSVTAAVETPVAVHLVSPAISLARAQLGEPRPVVEPVLALLGAAALFAAGTVLLATAVVMGPPTLSRPAGIPATDARALIVR